MFIKMLSRKLKNSNGLTSLKGKKLLTTYFEDSKCRNILVSQSSFMDLSPQEIFAKTHYMKPYIGLNVTDSLDGYFYKHQEIASKILYGNDSCIIVHEPGTGKTITQLKTFLDLLVAKAIDTFVIINLSENGNIVALRTLEKLYEDKYKKYFTPLTFDQFRRKYIDEVTISKISTYSYKDNMGIIIDEAHNLLSDNDTHKTIKVGLLKRFIEAISGKKGIKLLCSTATPFFGDSNSMGKFRSILFRNPDETENDIPGTMVSYIKINYDHLNIKFIQNDKYPGFGDESFIMSNGKKYDFPLYVVKPSPMQIADFYNLNFIGDDIDKIDKDRFQTYDKPLIVQSNPHLNPKTGKVEIQSAIIDECVEKIKNTEDGTVIFYTDIMKKGAKAIAELLEKHGFEKYSSKSSSKETTTTLTDEQLAEIDKITSEIKEISELIELIKERYTERSINELISLKNDLESLKKVLGDDNSIVKDSETYINFYQTNLDRDKQYIDQIATLEKQKSLLKEKIIFLKKGSNETNGKKKFKYIVYTSNMSAEDKEAFQIFNSSKNSDGNIIKAAVLSKIGRDGIDAKHVLFTFLVIPEWRIPGMIQAQHRGIRNNSHKDIIEKRAIKLQKEMEIQGIHISKGDAIKKIEERGIDVEIYIFLMDFDLLDEKDIDDARVYMVPESATRTSSEILEFLKSDQNEHKAGKKIINAAKAHHFDVGAQFMKLVSNSFDFFLNVKKNDRIKFAITEEEKEYFSQDFNNELIAQEETEMFYIDNYLVLAKKEIENMLIQKNKVNTDDIYDHFLQNKTYNFTEVIITEAIMNLVESGYIYNSKLAIVMNIKLWEKHEKPSKNNPNGIHESILFLDTCFSETLHPYISSVDSIPFSYFTISERTKTKIEKSDMDLPKKVSTYNKLKDVLERALDKDYILNVNEIEFLIQLSNYWSFSWKDMKDIEDAKKKNTKGNFQHDSKNIKTLENINVYVFPIHITNPDINILARGVEIYEYNLISKEWKKIQNSNIKNIFFVKSSSMIDLYRNTDFSVFPEFLSMVSNSKKDGYNTFDINGIVFLKGYYNPDYSSDENIVTQNLSHPDVLRAPIATNIVIKKFNTPQSKGSQIATVFKTEVTKKSAINYISKTMFSDISMFFFLYDKSTYKSGERPTIIDIKERERQEMIRAIEGKPSLRYQIPIVEKMIHNEERKIEIYKTIFNLNI